MDFTPEDMEAVQTCLEGIERNVPVTVDPAAAKLLMPNTVRTAPPRALHINSPNYFGVMQQFGRYRRRSGHAGHTLETLLTHSVINEVSFAALHGAVLHRIRSASKAK
jgi:hypothetical protein